VITQNKVVVERDAYLRSAGTSINHITLTATASHATCLYTTKKRLNSKNKCTPPSIILKKMMIIEN
jgi:hypothetical protein